MIELSKYAYKMGSSNLIDDLNIDQVILHSEQGISTKQIINIVGVVVNSLSVFLMDTLLAFQVNKIVSGC
ncbi:MAG: hypothetical protein RJQ00_05785 [Vicingaceae bacterium]